MKLQKKDLKHIELVSTLCGQAPNEKSVRLVTEGNILKAYTQNQEVSTYREIQTEVENPSESIYIDIQNFIKLTKKLSDSDFIEIDAQDGSVSFNNGKSNHSFALQNYEFHDVDLLTDIKDFIVNKVELSDIDTSIATMLEYMSNEESQKVNVDCLGIYPTDFFGESIKYAYLATAGKKEFIASPVISSKISESLNDGVVNAEESFFLSDKIIKFINTIQNKELLKLYEFEGFQILEIEENYEITFPKKTYTDFSIFSEAIISRFTHDINFTLDKAVLNDALERLFIFTDKSLENALKVTFREADTLTETHQMILEGHGITSKNKEVIGINSESAGLKDIFKIISGDYLARAIKAMSGNKITISLDVTSNNPLKVTSEGDPNFIIFMPRKE